MKYAKNLVIIALAVTMFFSLTACPAKEKATSTTTTEQAEEKHPPMPKTIVGSDQWIDENGDFKVCDFFESYGWTAEAEGNAYVARNGHKRIVLQTVFYPEWWVKDDRLDGGGLIFDVRCSRYATDFGTVIRLDNGNDVSEQLLALLQDYLLDPEGAECTEKNGSRGRFYNYSDRGCLDIDVYDCSERRYAESAQHERDKTAAVDYERIVTSVDVEQWRNEDGSFDISKMLSHYGWTLQSDRECGDNDDLWEYEDPFAVAEADYGIYGEMVITVENGYVSFGVFRHGLCHVRARCKADEAQFDGAQLVAPQEFVRLLEEVISACDSESSHEIFLRFAEEYRSGDSIEYTYESRMS